MRKSRRIVCVQKIGLTTITYTLFKIAQMMISMPALRTSVAATFFNNLKLEFHSIGIGIMIRKRSVATFETNDTHRIGFEIAAWQKFPGLGWICQ
jgi:hypothetical protein